MSVRRYLSPNSRAQSFWLCLVCDALPFILLPTSAPTQQAGGVSASVESSAAQDAHFEQASDDIVLDGLLNEQSWGSAVPVTRFYEIFPGNAKNPDFHTEARFLYDEQNIYVGIHAFDPFPPLIRSYFVRRDQVSADQDYLEILVDSANSKSGASFMRTNAAGALTDGQFDENTGARDYAPDLDFDVRTVITSDGWTAEFRIPLSSLRFSKMTMQSWRFVIYRNMPRSQTITLSSAPITRGSNCALCFAGVVDGLTVLGGQESLFVTPQVTFSKTRFNRVSEKSAHAGVDVKWKIRANKVLDVTVEPDFSQVEADDLQFRANLLFPLSVPEKRPFFLESVDLLLSPINAIYTRAFTSPQFGARMSSRGERAEYSVLFLKDTGGGFLVEPGPTFAQFGKQETASTAFVGRYHLRLGRDDLGVLASTRINDDGSRNIVTGVDSTWSFSKSDRISAQILGSSTVNPNRPDLLPVWVGQRFDGIAGTVRWERSVERWYSDLSYSYYSPGFRTWNGFVPQVGLSSWTFNTNYYFYPHDSPVTRAGATLALNKAKQVGGDTLRHSVSPGFFLQGPRDTTLTVAWNPSSKDITAKGLRSSSSVSLGLISTPFAWTPQVSLSATIGEAPDVLTGDIGRGISAQISIPVRLLSQFELTPLLGHQTLRSTGRDGPSQRLFTEQDKQINAIWHFSNRLYVRALYQQSRFTGFAQAHSPQSAIQTTSSLSSFLIGYDLNWQSRYFVGISRNRDSVSVPELSTTSETTVFAKFSYVFHR